VIDSGTGDLARCDQRHRARDWSPRQVQSVLEMDGLARMAQSASWTFMEYSCEHTRPSPGTLRSYAA